MHRIGFFIVTLSWIFSSSVLAVPPGQEDLTLLHSLSPHIDQLNQEQEDLRQLIIREWGLQEDVPLAVRKSLEQVVLPTQIPQDTLPRLLERFILPYDLLYDPTSVAQTHPILSERGELTLTHLAFETINRLIRDTEAFISQDLPSESFAWIVEHLRRGIAYYQKFMSDFCAADSVVREAMLSPQARMCGESLGYYLISQEKARELLFIDLYGQPTGQKSRTNPDEGMSYVLGRGGVHYKKGESEGEIDPALELAMYASSVFLTGQGITPSSFLYLDHVLTKTLPEVQKVLDPQQKEEVRRAKELFKQYVESNPSSMTVEEFFQTYPQYKKFFSQTELQVGSVQASKTAGEISLHEFLGRVRKGEASFDDLDPGSVSAFMTLSLVNVFADAKDDNIRLVQIKGKWHVIGIDNDHALANMIIRKEETDNPPYHLIQGKNVLFLIEELMNQLIDEALYKRLLSFNPYAYVLDWLKAIEDQNKRYTSLPLDRHTKAKYFPLQFCSHQVQNILSRLIQIQNLLKGEGRVSHQRLLSELYPTAASHYQRLREKDSRDPRFLQHVYLYGLNTGNKKSISNQFQTNPTLMQWAERAQAGEEFRPSDDDMATVGSSDLERKVVRLVLSQLRERSLAEVLETSKALALEDVLQGTPFIETLETETALDSDYVTKRTSTVKDELNYLLENTDFTNLTKLQRLEVIQRLVTYWPEVDLPFDLFAMDTQDGNQTVLQQVIGSNQLSPDVKTKAIGALLKNRVAGVEQQEMVSHQNQAGYTALDLAAEGQLEDIARILLDNGAGTVFRDGPIEKFYHAARVKAGWKTSRLRAVLKEKRRESRHLNWVLQRTKFLVPEGVETGEEVTILARNNGRYDPEKRYLLPASRDQLWDKKGQFKFMHVNDSRMVGRVLGNESMGEVKHRLYFKRFPAFPGTAMAISLLQELLFEEGWLPLTFAKIREEPFLISPGIGRLHRNAREVNAWNEVDNLQYILDHTPERLRELDRDGLIKVIILAMLINPEDGKPSNYAFERIGEGRSRLLEIDGEQAFVPGVSKPAERPKDFLVQLKSVLFCMDEMALLWNQVSAALLQRIREWDTFNLTKEWVGRLHQLHTRMQDLFGNAVPRILKGKASYVGVSFYRGEAQRVYEKLYRLQQHLAEAPEEQLLDTYGSLESFAASRYRKVFSDGGLRRATLAERFRAVDEKCYRNNAAVRRKIRQRTAAEQRGEPYLTSTPTHELLRSLNIPMDIPYHEDPRKRLAEGNGFDPQMALEELAKLKREFTDALLSKLVKRGEKTAVLVARILSGEPVDKIKLMLEGYPLHEQRLIFDQVQSQKPVTLIVRNNSLVTSSSLMPVLGDKIVKLELSWCLSIDNSIVNTLAESCSSLKSLDLSRCPKLSSFTNITLGLDTLVPVEFLLLEYLCLDGCMALKSLRIISAALGIIMANNCRILQNLTLITDELKVWSSKGTPRVTPSILMTSCPKAKFSILLLDLPEAAHEKVFLYYLYELIAVGWDRELIMDIDKYEKYESIVKKFYNAEEASIKYESQRQWFDRVQTGFNSTSQLFLDTRRTAFKASHLIAQFVGLAPENSLGISTQTAQTQFERLIKNRSFEEQFQLAELYWNIKKFEKAMTWYELAAEGGSVEAEEMLAHMYDFGLGIDPNEAEAFKWYTKAFNNGSRLVHYPLSKMYRYGRIVDKSLPYSVSLLRTGVRYGGGNAQYMLGFMIEHGLGAEKSVEEAQILYRQALVNPKFKPMYALYEIGEIYEDGTLVPKDINKAKENYAKSAELGYEKAQKKLQELEGIPGSSEVL